MMTRVSPFALNLPELLCHDLTIQDQVSHTETIHTMQYTHQTSTKEGMMNEYPELCAI